MDHYAHVDQLLAALTEPISALEKELPNVGYMLLSHDCLAKLSDFLFDHFTLLSDRTTPDDTAIGRARLIVYSPLLKGQFGLFAPVYHEIGEGKRLKRTLTGIKYFPKE